MTIEVVGGPLSVCQVRTLDAELLMKPMTFTACTDEEISLVCPTECVPADTVRREDGWRAFRIQGALDFSLIGILARISALLAEAGVGIFAVSTYNTDYILTKEEQFSRALDALEAGGCRIVGRENP